MSTENSAQLEPVSKKPRHSIEQKIADAQKMLDSLKKKKSEEDRKASEKNLSAIVALLKENGLEQIEVSVWSNKVKQLIEVLK